ncbi:hypothetical protein DFH06DRAFT_1219495 [Mycena polygramma]|nr:hypothetical protein DFH06DRAFT_1219495 [Mycena polygramma]
MQGVTCVDLHPALAQTGTPLAIDFASLPSAEGNAVWGHLLSAPATYPGLPSLTILSSRLPWPITAHASGRIDRCLTVADVIGAIWEALSLPVNVEQFEREITPQNGVSSPKRRTRGIEDQALPYRIGMTRLDFLGGKTRFAGLSVSTMGCDIWILEVV